MAGNSHVEYVEEMLTRVLDQRDDLKQRVKELERIIERWLMFVEVGQVESDRLEQPPYRLLKDSEAALPKAREVK